MRKLLEFIEIFKIQKSKIKDYFNTFQDYCWIFLLVRVMKISYANIAMYIQHAGIHLCFFSVDLVYFFFS